MMKITDRLINFIASFEGCYLKAYRCPAGVLTIGYGHTNGVKEGQTITRNTAKRFLEEDITDTIRLLEKRDTFKKIKNQYVKEAMVSFAFNCGVGNYDKLIKCNSNWYYRMINLKLYCNANGVPLKGLVRRRQEEKNLALTFTSNIKKGSTGILVTILQGMINEYINKYNINVIDLKLDGKFEEKTFRAVKRVQTHMKGTSDGVVKKVMWKKLILESKLNY